MLKSKPLVNFTIGILAIAALIFSGFYLYNRLHVQTVVIATNEEGSQSYIIAKALADAVHAEDSRIKVEILQTSGSVEIMDKMKTGQADFGTAQLDTTIGEQVETVAILYPQVFHIIVKNKSSILTPADLKGKKIATSSASGGGFKSIFEVLAYYGLTKDDVQVIPFENGDERDAAFINGGVDAMFRANTIGSSSLRDIASRTDIRFLPLDQYEGMRIQYPYLFQYTLPKGSYHADDPITPRADVKIVGVPTILFVNSKTDKAIVRLFTQTLFENQSKIIQETPQGLWITSPIQYENVLPAIHAGALAYYNRDQPSFFEKYYNSVSLGITLIPLIASIYIALQSRLITKQRDRAYRYNKKIAVVLSSMMTSPTATQSKQTELQLLETLEDVINDVNRGDLELGDLQAFSFVWDKALETVRYREAKLEKTKAAPERKQKKK
jgi:TRAP transporter TAXI family solute receptor